jgi:hypothetical protein
MNKKINYNYYIRQKIKNHYNALMLFIKPKLNKKLKKIKIFLNNNYHLILVCFYPLFIIFLSFIVLPTITELASSYINESNSVAVTNITKSIMEGNATSPLIEELLKKNSKSTVFNENEFFIKRFEKLIMLKKNLKIFEERFEKFLTDSKSIDDEESLKKLLTLEKLKFFKKSLKNYEMLLHRSLALLKLLKKYPLSDALKILKQNEQDPYTWDSIIKGLIIYYVGLAIVGFILKLTLFRSKPRCKGDFNSGSESNLESKSSADKREHNVSKDFDSADKIHPTADKIHPTADNIDPRMYMTDEDFEAIFGNEVYIPPKEFMADPDMYIADKDFDVNMFSQEENVVIPSTFQYSSEDERLKRINEICRDYTIPNYDSDSSESYTISECDSDSDQELSVPTCDSDSDQELSVPTCDSVSTVDQELSVPTCDSVSTVDKELSDSTSDKESSSVPTYDSVPLQLFNQEYLFTYDSDKDSSDSSNDVSEHSSKSDIADDETVKR